MNTTENIIIAEQPDGYAVRARQIGDTIITLSVGRGAKHDELNVDRFRDWGDLPEEVRDRFAARCPDHTGLWGWNDMRRMLSRVRNIGDAVPRVRELQSRQRAASERRQREDEERRAAELAARQPMIDAMLARETELLAQIPAGAIRCDTAYHSDGDGGSYATWSAEGCKISDPHIVGWAQATWPGAQEAFETRCVAYISRDELDALHAARRAAEEQAESTRQKNESLRAEAFRVARETGKRQVLLRWTTHRCMNGNSSECSFDSAVRWALPDGTERTTYTCCY